MAKRSNEDWAALIQQQSTSGLTISNFCRVHKLSLSGFYARKADMAKTSRPKVTPFVQATVTSPTAMTTQPTIAAQAIHFQHQTGLWSFPSSLPPHYLLEIIKGLQVC